MRVCSSSDSTAVVGPAHFFSCRLPILIAPIG